MIKFFVNLRIFDLNKKNNSQKTILGISIEFKRFDIVEILLDENILIEDEDLQDLYEVNLLLE